MGRFAAFLNRTRASAPGLSAALLAATYVAACLLPSEPSDAGRIAFRLDFELPYRVPLAGSVEPPISILADGRVLQNARYRLESPDANLVRVDSTERRLQGVGRGPASVRVLYQTAMGTRDTVFPVRVVVSRIAVDSPVTSLTRLGAGTQLSATAYDARDAAVPNVAFTWVSADPEVATVNGTGLVRAVGEGTVAIAAQADSVEGLASVTVTQDAAQVWLAPELDTLRTVGRSVQFIALVFDSSRHLLPTARPRWASSDTLVARVNEAGLATATGGGTARIIARVGDAADTATLVVAQVIRFLVVTPGFDTLTAIADTARVAALAFDSLNFPIPNPSVAWVTSDAAVATVDQAGLVRAARNGVVLVTASAAGQSAFATVVVRQEVATVQIAQDSVALTGAGDTLRLSATGLDRNGFVVDGAVLTWRSSDGFVATVSTAGLVTARFDGTTGIVATPEMGGQSDTATVSVTGAPPPPAVIAFGASYSGIEVMGADGSGHRVLIRDVYAAEPAWSPDGARLAFTRINSSGCADGDAGSIVTASSEGADERTVTGGCDNGPAWSPDGTKIAFSREVSSSIHRHIHVVNADGSNVRSLLGAGMAYQGYYINPAWSPDGTKLAFERYRSDSGYAVAVINADGTGFRAIHWGQNPAWSPDGAQLTFDDGWNIYVMNPDGSAVTLLVAGWRIDTEEYFSWGSNEQPAWSPDGAQIVFVVEGSEGGQRWNGLFVVNRDGSGLHELTRGGGYDSPSWRRAPPVAPAVRR